MLYLKEGVKLEITEEMARAIPVIMKVYRFLGFDNVTLTSANDGDHMEGSKHGEGNGLDIRIWAMAVYDEIRAVVLLKWELGPDYDIVQEKDHIHVEYDPK